MTAQPIKKLSPTGDRVLVLMDHEPEQVRGIIVSAGKPPPQNHGTVVAVGRDAAVAVGARILWSRWGGVDVEVGGIKHKVLRTKDKPGEIGEVLAVLDAKESA